MANGSESIGKAIAPFSPSLLSTILMQQSRGRRVIQLLARQSKVQLGIKGVAALLCF